MSEQLEGTEVEVRRVARAVDAARGLPRKDPPGRHRVPISDTPGAGWTIRHADITRHPTQRARYAYPVTPEVQRLHGRTVETDDGDVTIDTNGKVERGVDWDGGEIVRVAARGRAR